MNTSYFIAGNWKQNPNTIEEAKNIAKAYSKAASNLKHTQVVLCAPFVYISALKPKKPIENLALGAQSASAYAGGSHTGDVGAAMLKDAGVEYVIVGHSEERARGDSDAVVAARLQQVLAAGLKAIVCVGENKRDADGAYLEELKNQIKNTLIGINKKQAKDIVIAYEPVWAIGATEPMKTSDIHETSIFVKKVVIDALSPEVPMKLTILYGGSVNATNAAEIVSAGEVDGLLVGRESINPTGFTQLLQAVDILK